MNTNARFAKLFEPIKIGSVTIKNRIAMAGMATGFCSKEGLVTDQAKGYYEARAAGGAGMVIVESACVDFPRGHGLYRPVIHSDFVIPGMSELSKVIRKHGAIPILQLYHAGRMSRPDTTGFPRLGPSAIPYPRASLYRSGPCKKATLAEIHEIIDLFANAAARAKRAGFEGVELHAAHAYLLASFLSPISNRRNDRYGGNTEKRAQILVDILAAIREKVGVDFPVWCRINGQEYGSKEGLTLDDAKMTAHIINHLSSAIHVSAWGYGLSPYSMVYVPDVPGMNVPLAAEIKRVVTVPVIAVGNITPELGERVLQEGKADIICVGRGLIADPDLPNKAFSGKIEELRPCINCWYCSDVTQMHSKSIVCAVNPLVGEEYRHRIVPTAAIKKIAVIGGGPAGLEAARLLSLRGHKVTLFEKNNHLGGQVSLAVVPPHRARLEPLISYYVNQLKKQEVEVKLNTSVSLTMIEKMKPDAIILATGAQPIVSDIPGVDRENVVTAFDVLSGKVKVSRYVVVIGGGAIGCETAEFLNDEGCHVKLIEMLSDLASDMGPRDRLRLLYRIRKLPIKLILNTKCIRINANGIIVMNKDKQMETIRADTVVLALGTKPNNTLYEQLISRGFDVRIIGDAWHIGKIVGAVNEGMSVGLTM